jgi:hypothetical protein
MPVSLQVTLGSSATQISKHGIAFKQMYVQVNGTNNCRIGGSNVIAGAYGTGLGLLVLSAGGGLNWGPTVIQGGLLSNWYIAGTSGDVIDVTYEGA